MPTLTVNQIEGSKPQLVAGLVAGTTNEYQVLKVNADGSLSGAGGDKYLTSSTTSLAVTNGSKTLTVATGLAYTPTQAVTIVYDASNHMHATVASYNSTTGSMVVNVTSNTGSGTYALWTVNVGGIGSASIPAAGTTGQVLTKVSGADYDDAWQTPAAATSTTAGTVPGIGGTALANALTIALAASNRELRWPTGSNIFAPATTLSGGTTRNEISCIATTGTTPLSTSLVRSQGPDYFSFTAGTTYNASSNAVDFDRTLIWSFILGGMGAETSTGTVRVSFGKSSADGVGQLTRKGWQIRIEGSSTSRTVFIAAHNGTALGTEVAVTGSAINNGGYDTKPVVVVCSGGTMSLYVGDAALNMTTPTATCTGGATGASATAPYLQVEVLNGANAAEHRCDIYNIKTLILK
jgi:hypothetical protein